MNTLLKASFVVSSSNHAPSVVQRSMARDPPAQGHRVLVINPNTSTFLTDSFRPILSDLLLSSDATLTYWTCPAGGPAMIKSHADMTDSAARCLPLLLKLAPNFDGFLAACYADHPIVDLLQSRVGRKPVVCIFHASVYAALQLNSQGGRFGILTTAPIYETLLEDSVKTMLRSNKQALARFAGVAASGIGLADLQRQLDDTDGQQEKVTRRKIMNSARRLLRTQGAHVDAICMGGVVLAGLETWVHEACEAEGRGNVMVVDQLAAGMLTLDALLGRVDLRTVDYHQALK
jgi:Asp/Glu/hydantoin racemase